MRAQIVIAAMAVIAGAAAAALSPAAPAGVRSVFLNGVDISSAKSQDLKNVDLHINEAGDVFIIAPHYQVNEEDTYVPLSKYVQGLNAPAHKEPQPASGAVPLTKAVDQVVPKAGEPLSPPAGGQMIPAAAPEAKSTAQPLSGSGASAPAAGIPAAASPAGQPPAAMKGDPPPPTLPGDEAIKEGPPLGQAGDAG
jgi:hypothetical protein